MESYQNDEIEIDLKELVSKLLSKAWIMIVVAMITASVGYGYSKYIAVPTYKSTSKIYILTRTESLESLTALSWADIQIGTQLTQDYKILIKSRPVMERVIDNLGLNMSYGQLQGLTSITNPDGTRVLVISVTYTDAFMAKQIVDEISEVSCEQIAAIMDIDRPNVVENGYVASAPSSPDIKKNILLAGVAGFVLTAAIVVLLYLFDDSIKTSADIEKYLGVSALGMIPLKNDKNEKNKETLKTKYKKNNPKY